MNMQTSLNDNIDNIQNDKPPSGIFIILSLSSWIILIITCWMPILVVGLTENEIFNYFWLFYKEKESKEDLKYNDKILDINFVVFYIIIIITLVITTLGFLIYIYSFYNQKEKILKGMFGPYSRFHFIPILFIDALFIIGESYSESIGGIKYITTLIFTFLAIISLIYISLTTKMTSLRFATLTINKGAYSCFFALLVYNFGYTFSNYILSRKFEKESNKVQFFKDSYLAFVIIIGIVNNAASLLLQDFMIAIINLLIYLGMTINFYKIDGKFRKNELKLYSSIGILDIIMMILSLFCINYNLYRS